MTEPAATPTATAETTPTEDRDATPGTSPAEALVRADGLSVAYRTDHGPVTVARDVSFAVAAGQTLAIVGESGSGKSTVAGTLLGHLRDGAHVTAGRVTVAGRDVFGLDRRALRALRGGTVAMLGQNPGSALTPSMRVGAQVAEAMAAHGLSREQRRARVGELFATVRLPEPETIGRRYPHQLSGGQQQRVAIAMALAARPRVLVLDEPTTALDVVTQERVLDLLAELSTELGLATVVVSHDLGVVARLADHVLVMREGEVVESAPATELFAAPAHAYTRRLLASVPRVDDGGLAEVAADGTRTVRPRHTVPADAPEIVRLTDVTIDYGRRRAVDGVSLSLRRGEVLALVGESGSGKSTLAWALAGLHPPTSGTMRMVGTGSGTDTDSGRSAGAGDGSVGADGASGSAGAAEAIGASTSGADDPGDTGPDIAPSASAGSEDAGTSTGDDDGTSVRAGDNSEGAGSARDPGESGPRPAASVNANPTGGSEDTAGHADTGDLTAPARRRPLALRRRVQLAFQNADTSLNPRRRVREAVRRPLRFFGLASGADVDARARELIADVALDPELGGRLPQQLSGGQRQRVGIARALAGSPDVVVADEVTTALDVSVQAAVLTLLADLRAEHDLSYVFISHDLAVVRGIADRVAVLRDGRVVEEGPTDAVFAGPNHPYTRTLLDAVLEPGPAPERQRPRNHLAEPPERPESAGTAGSGFGAGSGEWIDLGGGHRVRRWTAAEMEALAAAGANNAAGTVDATSTISTPNAPDTPEVHEGA